MRALVTGGGGFLGKAIVRRLLDRGYAVVSLARGDYPELREWGVETARGDISKLDDVKKAAKDCDIVFHVAALAEMAGPWEKFHNVNVVGTRNVIETCLDLVIPKLVYTSSPSVVFDGHDHSCIDESVPYPDRYLSPYPRSKAIAEREVLAVDQSRLATVSLRPHLIWGPGDNHLVPTILRKNRKGHLFLVGEGQNRIDPVFIDNAAEAHILAAEKLGQNQPCPLCGKAYFIGNGQAVPMRKVIDSIIKAGGQEPSYKSIPFWLAYAIGAANEIRYKLFIKDRTPSITRFVALQLTHEHWFDLSAAKSDFGYEPNVSFEEGMEKLTKSLKNQDQQ